MSVSILENIRTKCPGLYNDADRAIYISNAELLCSLDFFGAKYNLAVALRACHDYTLVDRANATGGVGGNITSIKEDALQVSYAAATGGNTNELDQTTFGTQLKYLIKICKPAVSLGTTNISVLGGFPKS